MNPDQKDNYWQEDPDEAVPEVQPAPTVATDAVSLNSSEQLQSVADPPVNWTASEYIHNDKNGLWYVIFVLVVLGLIAVAIFVFKSYTFSALVIVMAIALIIYSRRPPRIIQYTLSAKQGLYIGERLYHFDDFKAFGLIRDGEHHSIMLIPTKRFATGVSVYFPEEVGEQIVDILGGRLPMRPLKLDAIDLIIRQLHL